MSNVDSILAELRDALKEELRAEVRAEIIKELSGGARTQAPKAKSGPKPKAALIGDDRPVLAKKILTVKPGQRRTPEEVEQAGRVLTIWFGKNPASRIDQAAAALGVPVKDLQLPVQALLAAKKLTKKGKLRGTTYTVRP